MRHFSNLANWKGWYFMRKLKSLGRTSSSPCLYRILATIGVLSAVLLTASISSAQNAAEPEATFNLAASDREIDEGGVVQFIIEEKKYWDPSTGQLMKFEADLSPVEWDFGDGRQDPASAYGLYDMKHWFADDKESPFLVKASHQGNTEQISIKVNDVLPVIHSIAVTENPREGMPVVFQAAVRDPGFNDEITYTWDFGGGVTATGRNARHTWNDTGVKEVTLAVEDDARDDPPRTFTFHVTVADDQYYDDNEFSVFGRGFSAVGAPIDGLILVGATGNVTEASAGGSCQIRIEMHSSDHDMGIVLTAHLDPGLAPGNYAIGETKEWGGTHVQDVAARGTFFAEFIPPNDEAFRMVDGKKIGGPFWSDQGHVTVRKFEAGELELIFDMVLTENIPATISEPRQVAVMGALVTEVPVAVTTSDISDPSAAPNAPGLDILARSVMSTGQDQPNSVRRFANEKYYSCAGQEPEAFEVVAATPGANDVNVNFEDSIVEVEFSQSVDPDSIVHPETLADNLLFAARGNDGYRLIGGSWMPSKQNPKAVQFIPQSRLLPGVVHCVYVAGGEQGVRSFTGNVLGGTSLNEPSDRMAQACTPLEGYEARHAFSTRVEVESIGVQLYQASLLGPHAPFVTGRTAVARVYPWWQDSIRSLHPSAAVREFEARVFAVVNRQRLSPLSEGGEVGQTQIRRPDLYSAGARRNMLHSIEFSYAPVADPGAFDLFSVIQPLNRERAPVDPVDQSVIHQMETAGPFKLTRGILTVKGECAGGSSDEDCGWGYEFGEEPEPAEFFLAASKLQASLPPIADHETLEYQESFAITEECTGGFIYETCFTGASGPSLSAEEAQSRIQKLANQIVNNPTIYKRPEPDFDLLEVMVPRGMMPDGEPLQIFQGHSGGPPMLFAEMRDFPSMEYVGFLLRALGEEYDMCSFAGNAACDHTPVQGLWYEVEVDNRHHAEVIPAGRTLVPLLKTVDYDDYPPEDFHISAWNYARLYEALQCLNDHQGCE